MAGPNTPPSGAQNTPTPETPPVTLGGYPLSTEAMKMSWMNPLKYSALPLALTGETAWKIGKWTATTAIPKTAGFTGKNILKPTAGYAKEAGLGTLGYTVKMPWDIATKGILTPGMNLATNSVGRGVRAALYGTAGVAPLLGSIMNVPNKIPGLGALWQYTPMGWLGDRSWNATKSMTKQIGTDLGRVTSLSTYTDPVGAGITMTRDAMLEGVGRQIGGITNSQERGLGVAGKVSVGMDAANEAMFGGDIKAYKASNGPLAKYKQAA